MMLCSDFEHRSREAIFTIIADSIIGPEDFSSGRRGPGVHRRRSEAGGARGFESPGAGSLSDRLGASAAGVAGGECKFTQRASRGQQQPLDHFRHGPIADRRQISAPDCRLRNGAPGSAERYRQRDRRRRRRPKRRVHRRRAGRNHDHLPAARRQHHRYGG